MELNIRIVVALIFALKKNMTITAAIASITTAISMMSFLLFGLLTFVSSAFTDITSVYITTPKNII